MVLKAIVASEVVHAAHLDRGAGLRVVPKFLKPLTNGVSLWDRPQVREGYFVLSVHPVRHIRMFADIAFQPAIWIGHLDAVPCVHDFTAAGIRVRDRRRGEQGRGKYGNGDKHGTLL